MNIMARFAKFFADAEAKPLPPHVRDVKLNIDALALHMSNAHKPSDRTEIGYKKPARMGTNDKS